MQHCSQLSWSCVNRNWKQLTEVTYRQFYGYQSLSSTAFATEPEGTQTFSNKLSMNQLRYIRFLNTYVKTFRKYSQNVCSWWSSRVVNLKLWKGKKLYLQAWFNKRQKILRNWLWDLVWTVKRGKIVLYSVMLYRDDCLFTR